MIIIGFAWPLGRRARAACVSFDNLICFADCSKMINRLIGSGSSIHLNVWPLAEMTRGDLQLARTRKF